MHIDMNRREKIIEMLKEEPISFMSIANKFGMPIKELEEVFENISNSIPLKTKYASCKKCNFVFDSDKRYKTPSKCPECHGERIDSQKFWIEE